MCIIRWEIGSKNKRKDLKSINSTLEDNLFYLFNNINIRHNNTNPNDKSKYKAYVANLSQNELEDWYDETYQLCLLAFLELDNVERNNKIKQLKQDISNINAILNNNYGQAKLTV